MKKEEIETFYPAGRKQWRSWLQKHHSKKESIWLICYKKESDMPTVTWSEAVDEALCFGWIDSKRKPIDDEKFMQYFCKRKPNGMWSKINKEKIQQLTSEGKIAKAGFAAIEAAKKNGSWTILDQVDEFKIPTELNKEFKHRPGAKKYFLSLSRSDKKAILIWLVLAKREETRQKRIKEIVLLASQNLKPKQFR